MSMNQSQDFFSRTLRQCQQNQEGQTNKPLNQMHSNLNYHKWEERILSPNFLIDRQDQQWEDLLEQITNLRRIESDQEQDHQTLIYDEQNIPFILQNSQIQTQNSIQLTPKPGEGRLGVCRQYNIDLNTINEDEKKKISLNTQIPRGTIFQPQNLKRPKNNNCAKKVASDFLKLFQYHSQILDEADPEVRQQILRMITTQTRKMSKQKKTNKNVNNDLNTLRKLFQGKTDSEEGKQKSFFIRKILNGMAQDLTKGILYSADIKEKHLRSYLCVYKLLKIRSRSSILVGRLQNK